MRIEIIKKCPQFPKFTVGTRVKVNRTLGKNLVKQGYADEIDKQVYKHDTRITETIAPKGYKVDRPQPKRKRKSSKPSDSTDIKTEN